MLIGPIGARVPAQALRFPTAPGARGGRGPRVVQPAALGAYVGPAAHDPSLIARLGAVSVPALVIPGSEDQMTSPVQARAWATALGCPALSAPTITAHPFQVQEALLHAWKRWDARDLFPTAGADLEHHGAGASLQLIPGQSAATVARW